MRFSIAILITLHCLTLSAGEILLPTRAVTVLPESAPTVVLEPVTEFTADEWYLVESTVPLACLTSPVGVMAVEELSGPMTFRGRFAGGNKIETRKFAGPYLYAVTAETTGKAELIAIESLTEIQRITLTVTGPRPPPKPEPTPDPEPEPPKPTPVVKNVSLAIVEDTMNRSPEMAITLNSLVGWNEFGDSGNVWRLYDRTTKEPKGKEAIATLDGICPGIVVRDKSTGKVLSFGSMPTNFDDLKALIRRLKGG